MIREYAWIAYLQRGGVKLIIQARDESIAFGIAAGMPDPAIVYPSYDEALKAAQTWNGWLDEQRTKVKTRGRALR